MRDYRKRDRVWWHAYIKRVDIRWYEPSWGVGEIAVRELEKHLITELKPLFNKQILVSKHLSTIAMTKEERHQRIQAFIDSHPDVRLAVGLDKDWMRESYDRPAR